MQADQDDISLGSVHVVQNAEDFHVHGFGLYALKHREGIAAHAGMNLIHRDGRLRSLSVQDETG